MFDPAHPIERLRPADYNPRSISADSLQGLRASLRQLGIVKPVVALADGLIVAGHQRTKAAGLEGFTHTPVCFLSKTPNAADEIAFNQMHNGTDLDSGAEGARVPPTSLAGWADVELVAGNFRSPGASTRAELARLLAAYGNWGGCVASMSGDVLSGASYALAASALGLPVRVFYVDDQAAALVRQVFAQQYGRFDYSRIERQTYVQTFAQMYRLREGAGRANKSPTYEWLLRETPKAARILDFGCGQGDYVRALKAQGYDIHGLEFFRRKGGQLDIGASQRMIDDLVRELRTRGLFDVVMCDYVLNSVDSQQAQADVLACLNAFCKPGGQVYFSGRKRDRVAVMHAYTKTADSRRYAEFPDEHGLSALFRAGQWFFQKFHSAEEVAALVRSHFDAEGRHQYRDNSSTAWQVSLVKAMQAPDILGAIDREFNLPLPNGRRFGRQADVWSALAPLL